MATSKPETLYYVIIRTTKKPVKTRALSVYKNGIPETLDKFKAWLKKAIEEKVKK